MGNVQTTIMNSARNETSGGYVEGFTGDGYTALAIVYSSFSLFNWFAPSVVSILGPRITLVVGGIIYSLYIAQIIYPNTYLFYCGALLQLLHVPSASTCVYIYPGYIYMYDTSL